MSILDLVKETTVGDYKDMRQQCYDHTGAGKRADNIISEKELIADLRLRIS